MGIYIYICLFLNIKQIDMRSQQEQIVTQSQLKLALDFLNTKKTDVTFKELLATTNILVDYVINGYTPEIGQKAVEIDKHFKNKQNGNNV